jgi:hypothetical protein
MSNNPFDDFISNMDMDFDNDDDFDFDPNDHMQVDRSIRQTIELLSMLFPEAQEVLSGKHPELNHMLASIILQVVTGTPLLPIIANMESIGPTMTAVATVCYLAGKQGHTQLPNID